MSVRSIPSSFVWTCDGCGASVVVGPDAQGPAWLSLELGATWPHSNGGRWYVVLCSAPCLRSFMAGVVASVVPEADREGPAWRP